MGKTITIRIDDDTYEKIKSAAESEKRTISNFMEYATLSYVESSSFVSEEEMQQLAQDAQLLSNIKESLDDIQNGRYRLVE